jgi:hypothetical protein
MIHDPWLQAAASEAKRRELPDMIPLLETLARATEVLRTTDYNDPESDELARHGEHPGHADD